MLNISDLLGATKPQEIRDLIDKIKQRLGSDVVWKDVGGRENNLATINMGTDPASALTERLTNAIDAVIDHRWMELNKPTNVSSPREAVEKWFGIEGGHLSNVENLRDEDIKDIRDRVRVTLRDSGVGDQPTVDVRDRGIGIKAENFADSILSLNQSRKLSKFHLAGAFGQGGSTALAGSEYTLIVSKAAPTQDESPPVAFTIVRFNEGDLELDKHGTYEFMVNPRTGQPFTIEGAEDAFPHGTLVRHVSMDVGKFNSVMTSPTSGLYYLVHHYLFDPLLPLIMEEERSSHTNRRRTAAGNNRRLTTSDICEYTRDATQVFRDGKVKIKWWVISSDEDGSKKPRNRIKNYTLASKPIIVTYNGQKQGEFPNTVIKKDLQLPYLERYLVVHIDCDEIDNATRRKLFPTTRESLRDTTITDDLRELIVETLGEDEELLRLDRERKKRYLQKTDTESTERIRKRLASRIKARLKSDGTGSSGGTGRTRRKKKKPAPKPEPIPVQEPPTFIEITSEDPREIHPGKRFTLSFRTDAKADYFMKTGSFVPLITPASMAEYTGATSVQDGHGKAHFIASESATIDEEGSIALEVRPDRSPSLSDSTAVKVTPFDGGTGSGGGNSQVPNINPQWVQKGDDFWNREGWDESSVAKVISDDESTEVYISADNENLNALIKRAQRRSTGTVDSIKDFYMEHVAYHAVVAHLDITETPPTDEEEKGLDPSGLEQEQENELMRVSRTVCGIMEELFDVIAQGEFESVDAPTPSAPSSGTAENGESA